MTAIAAPRKRSYRMVARADAVAATRERILAAAWRRFADVRYEDVRIADVAADAGVTAQTVHSRFGTKDRLFLCARRWRDRADRSLAVRDQGPALRLRLALDVRPRGRAARQRAGRRRPRGRA